MRKRIILSIAIIGVFFLTNYSQTTEQTFEPVKNPGQFIVEVANLAYSSLDTATNYENGGSGLNSLICETLYDYDNNSLTDLVPVLAKDAPVWSTDGKHFSVTLKQGIKFHDGVEFNAWVYKYSIDRVMLISDPNSGTFLFSPLKGGETAIGYSNMNITEAKGYLAEDAIHVDSDYKITFNLDYSYVPIIHTLIRQTGCAISPKAVIDNIPSTFMTDGNNDTGMINLADWFPALNGNYTKLGLALNADSKKSGVIPSGIVDEGSPSQHTWFKDHMVGTGPWILSNKTQFLIELNRNENWWNKEKFAPNAPNKIVLKAVADPTLRAESFTNGDADRAEIDYTLIDQFSFPNGSTKKDTIKAYKFDKINVDFFGFNLRNGSELGDGYINMFETSKSWWNNNSALIAAGFVGYEHLPKSPEVSNPFTVLKFRKAFSLAFNYSAYSDKVLNGFANRMEGLIPKGLLGHQDNLIEQGYIPEFDVESAKMLFEELGWRGTITIPYNDGSTARKSIALMLKQTIESMNVGINIVASEMNWATFLMQFYKTPLFFLGWNPDIPDPDNYITSFVHSIKGYYSSRIQYINPNLDPMLSEASSELDPSQRSVLYANLEKYIAEEGIFIYAAQQYEISRIWYQWNGLEESGSLNPMRFFPRAHLMEKVEQEKIPVGQIVTITAPTKTISSLSFPTSSTAPNTSTISINSSVQPSSTSDKNIITSTDLSGFELVSIAGMFVVGAILYKRRK